MAITVTIPRLGWNMEEGVFLGWLKRDGEAVRAGEPLFTLEGEKAAQEIEAVEDGIVWIDPNGPQPGAVVPVGAEIGALLRPGEGPPAAAPVPTLNRVAAAVGDVAMASPRPVAVARDRPRSSPL